MIRPWKDIKQYYADLVAAGVPLNAMVELVEQIEASKYIHGIYAWTSMHDLAIVQTPSVGMPYLKISPPRKGKMTFEYLDTHVDARIWRRVVDEAEAFSRLERFFDQLHWFSQTHT